MLNLLGLGSGRKASPQSLARRRGAAFMAAAVEGGTVPVMMVDRDLIITYVNKATRDLFRNKIDVFRTLVPGHWRTFFPRSIFKFIGIECHSTPSCFCIFEIHFPLLTQVCIEAADFSNFFHFVGRKILSFLPLSHIRENR